MEIRENRSNRPHDSAEALAGDGVPALRVVYGYALECCALTMASPHLSRFDFESAKFGKLENWNESVEVESRK